MTAETDDLKAALNVVWNQLYPHRPEKKDFSDEVIALGIALRRDMDMKLKTRVIEPAYADGICSNLTARPVSYSLLEDF